jgi:lipooligosaccharide transport system ATP-binding protein
MKMIACASPVTEGTLSVIGMDPRRQARDIKARLGVVPQIDNLDTELTVRENLLMYARYFDIPGDVAKQRASELLEFVQLDERSNDQVEPLSGGMKRRLTIARALINEPDLVILDEPTTGLDPQARHLMWEKLRALLREGKTILLTTHFMDEAERLCDRIQIIDEGRRLAEGSPQALIAGHIEPEVVEVYGEGVEEWLASHGRGLSARAELHGETAFCYLRDPAPVVASLRAFPRLRFVHRPANLEDVFLKLTGRELRE